MKLIAIYSLCLLGCAQQHLTTPQPGTVQGGISNVRAGVTKAQTEQTTIEQHNATVRSNLDRADRKNVIINEWKKWKAQHPDQQ